MLKRKRKDKWESDKENEIYYKEKWIKTVQTAGLDPSENQYIDKIFVQMKDANKYSGINRSRWKISEYSLIVCSSVIACLNTIAATTVIDSKWSSLINIAAAIVASIISIINGVKILAAYRETWLRHSKFRSLLVMECHNFATDSGEYKTIAKSTQDPSDIAAEKIVIFKNNTTQLIQDDYDNFFANMRSS